MKQRLRRLSAVLGLVGLVACAQTGGGDVCPCATPWIITATHSAGQTITPMPSVTLAITPTQLPPMPTFTPGEHNPECKVKPGAAPIKPYTFYYRYTDPNRTGYAQNVRSCPRSGANGCSVVGLLDTSHQHYVWWASEGWVSITPDCTQWVWTPLGEMIPAGAD